MAESTKLGDDLTKVDRETLKVIADLIREYGVSPTWREIATRRGKQSAFTAAHPARRLRERGYVQWWTAHRSLRLTDRGTKLAKKLSQSDG